MQDVRDEALVEGAVPGYRAFSFRWPCRGCGGTSFEIRHFRERGVAFCQGCGRSEEVESWWEIRPCGVSA
jgi:hypothetical protein